MRGSRKGGNYVFIDCLGFKSPSGISFIVPIFISSTLVLLKRHNVWRRGASWDWLHRDLLKHFIQ